MKMLLFAALVLGVVIIVGYAVFENPHSFQSTECGSCHVDSEHDPKVMTAPITELCRRCHKQITSRSSHPVNVRPVTTRIPSDLALKDGVLTCSTCHNVHKERFSLTGEKTYFLRRPVTGREFCLSCHTSKMPESGGHPAILGVAHISTKFRVTDTSQPIDPLSMECIICHAGIAGQITNFGMGVWSHDGSSHPIGVDYQESRMKDGNLKPISTVSRKIRLFSGKVGCGTCHDAYSRLPNHLVVSNEGSRLCTECHNL